VLAGLAQLELAVVPGAAVVVLHLQAQLLQPVVVAAEV